MVATRIDKHPVNAGSTHLHHGIPTSTSIINETARSASSGNTRGLRDVLDFLVTEEQLCVTFVTAAIERAAGTPSEAFVPVLRNAVTTEFHHVQALKAAGGHALTTSYWFPDAAFDDTPVSHIVPA